MSKYIYYSIIVLIALSISACDKNNTSIASENVEVEDYHPNPQVNEKIKQLFSEYNSIIITNVEVKDYKFNFNAKNKIDITPLDAAIQEQLYAISVLEEVLFSLYSKEFLVKYLPYSILLAKNIETVEMGVDENDIVRTHYTGTGSRHFIALGDIPQKSKGLSPEEKNKLQGWINSALWADYQYFAKENKIFSDDFFEVSGKEGYGKSWEKNPKEINFYQEGFISYGSYTEDPKWGPFVEAPSKDLDLKQWLAFVFGTKQEDLKAILGQYPKMKQKYEHIKAAFDKLDFDITQLNK